MTREEIFAQLYSGDTVYPPPLESRSALLEITTGCSYRKCKFCDFPKRIKQNQELKKAYLNKLIKDLNKLNSKLCFDKRRFPRS